MPSHRRAAALTLLLLAGCSQFAVTATKDPSANMTTFQRFAYIESADDPWRRRLARDGLDVVIGNEIDAALTAKGFQRADPPDFLVHFHVGIGSQADVQAMARGLGYGYGWFNVTVDDYREGTLVIAVIDAKSRMMVWRGTASARTMPTSSLQEKRERMREATAAILAKFPAKGAH